MTSAIVLDGRALTPARLVVIADGSAEVRADPAALDRMLVSSKTAARVAARRPVYGRTTGVGANVEVADPDAGGLDLLRSHAGGAGPPVAEREVRGMLAVRANQLLVGASGADPRLATALVDALAAGALPGVHRFGSIGTGDLTALAGTALCLLGERPWARGSLPPVEFGPGDALAFLSSSALTIAQAALAFAQLERLADASLVVAALSAAALGASVEPFAAEVHAARPHAGAIETARRMRALLPAQSGSRVQDPYGIRAIAQVHGTLLDVSRRLDDVLRIELNTGAENPFVSIAADEVFHHGGWLQAPLASALDGFRLALLSDAQLGLARIGSLVDPRYTHGLPFLAQHRGGSGVLVLEYTAASALAALRSQAAPVALGSAVVSLGVENHASFAAEGADLTGQAITPYRVLLGAELVCAVRALRPADDLELPAALAAAYDLTAGALPDDRADRPLENDLEIADGLLDQLGTGMMAV